MHESKDIVLSIDYHADNIEFRWLDLASGEERTGNIPTSRPQILQLIQDVRKELSPGGQIVWLIESTTGWARVKDLLDGQVRFVLTNEPLAKPPESQRKRPPLVSSERFSRRLQATIFAHPVQRFFAPPLLSVSCLFTSCYIAINVV